MENAEICLSVEPEVAQGKALEKGIPSPVKEI